MYVHRDQLGDLQVGQEIAFTVFVNEKQQTQATSLLAENNGTNNSGGGKPADLAMNEKVQVSIKGTWFVGKVQNIKDGKAQVLCDIDEMDLKRRLKTPPSKDDTIEVDRDGGSKYKGTVLACIKNIPHGYKLVVTIGLEMVN